ncbi:MAG: hypothetical protein IJY15_06060 [Thermoguttaceae bacterium]|nr:hypothetical protein [Thermoguttaceae bacterium]
MRTISVPEDGFHNNQDRELYVGLKGVADVLSQAKSFDGLLQKLEPYSERQFSAKKRPIITAAPFTNVFSASIIKITNAR